MGHKANSPIPSPSLRGGGKVGSASTCVLCLRKSKENPLENSNLFSLPPPTDRGHLRIQEDSRTDIYLWQTWISGGHTGTICGSPVSPSSSSSSPPRLAQPMPRAQRGSGDPGAGASPSPAGTLGGGRGPREGRRSSRGREAGEGAGRSRVREAAAPSPPAGLGGESAWTSGTILPPARSGTRDLPLDPTLVSPEEAAPGPSPSPPMDLR
jgi:hypothetical protein